MTFLGKLRVCPVCLKWRKSCIIVQILYYLTWFGNIKGLSWISWQRTGEEYCPFEVRTWSTKEIVWKILIVSNFCCLKVDGNEKWEGSGWRQFFGYSLALWRSKVFSSLNVPFLCTTHYFCFRLLQLYRKALSRRIGEALRIWANRTSPVFHSIRFAHPRYDISQRQ